MDTTLTIPSVTGIDIALRVAGPGGRSYAFIVDWHIRFLAAVAWILAGMLAYFGELRPAMEGDAAAAGYTFGVLLPAAAIYFLYHPVLEVLMRGRTPGKRIAGVRLIKRDGGIPGTGALLVRNVFRLVDSLPMLYLIGLVSTVVTKHALRIGDIAAGTLLVYDAPRARDVTHEISLRAIERLGLRNAELVRELLTRWSELDPPKRSALAERLLAHLDAGEIATTDEARRAQLEHLLADADVGAPPGRDR